LFVVFLKSQSGQTEQAANAASTVSHSQVSLDLSPSQVNSIKIQPLGSYIFPVEKAAVGNISLADDLSSMSSPTIRGSSSRLWWNWAIK